MKKLLIVSMSLLSNCCELAAMPFTNNKVSSSNAKQCNQTKELVYSACNPAALVFDGDPRRWRHFRFGILVRLVSA